MVEIKLTGPKSSTHVAFVSDEDYEVLSLFSWCVTGKGHIGRTVREYDKTGKCFRKGQIWMHRIVAARMGLDIDGSQVDHINLDKKDNRRENLRRATNQQNQANRTVSKKNTSGFKGVSWHKYHQRWSAKIGVGYKRIHLGFFDTPEEASEAYEKAAQEHHGIFGRKG